MAGRDIEGRLLWEPTPQTASLSNVAQFMRWLRQTRGLDFTAYDDLWR